MVIKMDMVELADTELYNYVVIGVVGLSWDMLET
jgi:hypothetical protein